MSSIAVFLVLGGATAFAAGQLGKNSVGSKQLKKNAVTTAKIKNNAVTTAKIENGAITGAKVNLGSLGTVPNAAHAGSADSAAVAGKVNGISLSKFDIRSNGGTGETTVFNNGHLRVTFACDGAGNITVLAYTASDHASIQSYGNDSDTRNSDWSTTETETISASNQQRDIVFTDESGNLVHLSYMAEQARVSGPRCIFAGFAEEG
jgi:hypothetical protein